MRSNDMLVDHMLRRGYLDGRLEAAFRAVDRMDFVRDATRTEAYGDYPLPIGKGQTISQPSTVAFMLGLLDVQPGMRVLDVGCGSGYTTALLLRLVGPEGEVIGVERIPSLVEFARSNLSSYDGTVRIEHAGTAFGLPGEAPFDRILVSAAADNVPAGLIDQLATDGVLVIPVRSSVHRIEKHAEDEVSEDQHYGFSFVPLVDNAAA